MEEYISMKDLAYDKALLMVPSLSSESQEMLKAMCQVAEVMLESRLRSNLTTRDCHNQFVTAVALYAVAAMSEVTEMGQMEQITAGDLTLKRKDDGLAANCLRQQADALMAPYVKLGVAFQGV